MPEQPDAFELDGHHLIERGKVFPVCGNTWRMLADTRFAPHFDFIGDFATHYGIFPGCGTSLPFATTAAPPNRRRLLTNAIRPRHSREGGIQYHDPTARGTTGCRSSRAMTVGTGRSNAIRSDAPSGGRSARHLLSGDGGGRLGHHGRASSPAETRRSRCSATPSPPARCWSSSSPSSCRCPARISIRP